MFKNIMQMSLLVCFVCVLALGYSNKQSSDRLPLAVLIETNPWLWVLGSDSPVFALYDDGLVIYSKKEDAFCTATYYSAILTKSGVDSLVSSLYLSSIDSLPDKSVGTQHTDQPNNTLYFSDGDDLKSKVAYGNVRTDTSVRKLVPMFFVQTFDKLAHFNVPNAKPWLPEKIEILLQRHRGPEEPFPWPNGWPGINKKNSRDRGELVSFFIDSKYLEELQTLMRQLKQGQPLLISGKKWFATYRLPFPLEETWMQ